LANLFTDFPERERVLRENSLLSQVAIPFEDAYGEKGTYKTPEEAMDTYMGILSEIGKVFANEIRPNADAIDREGCRFEDGEVYLPEKLKENLRKCAEMGIFAAPVTKKHGGLSLPRAIQFSVMEMAGHACPNTGLSIANYSMAFFLERYGTKEQIEKYMSGMLEHRVTSSMALTEPNAGSDLGKLRSTGRKEGDHYVVNGTKQFISGGHADFTFALVRTDPSSSGLKGLSVILVPRFLDDAKTQPNFKVAKIEHKINLHGSPTCELVFENSIGTIFGPEGAGFKVMADLMNEARLAMAALALGIATGALEEAKRYAKTRVTMGKPIIQHPMVADMIYEMEMETRAMRALTTEAANAYDMMLIAEAQGNEAETKKWKKRYRRLTPLAKYFCCEKAIPIARNAVQIFGGYGVCTEYPVERLLRETIIYPIYEGTSQIQSLMVLKDTLKDVAMNATGFLGSLAGAWAESKVTLNPVKSKLLQARNELNQAIRTMLMSIIKDKFKSDIESLKQQKIQEFLKDFSMQLVSEKTDLTLPFLWAERFTRITSDYYALKCLADHHKPGDSEQEKWILEFAALCLPRMQLENHYMVHRLPSTLEYMKTIPME